VCIAFTLGCGDREAISRVETTSGTDGGDIRDVMIETRQAASGSLPMSVSWIAPFAALSSTDRWRRRAALSRGEHLVRQR
jgi:hypothetical protein